MGFVGEAGGAVCAAIMLGQRHTICYGVLPRRTGQDACSGSLGSVVSSMGCAAAVEGWGGCCSASCSCSEAANS
jgi:hypothetical protein